MDRIKHHSEEASTFRTFRCHIHVSSREYYTLAEDSYSSTAPHKETSRWWLRDNNLEKQRTNFLCHSSIEFIALSCSHLPSGTKSKLRSVD